MMRVNGVVVRQLRESPVSFFIYETSKFTGITESRRSREGIGNVVDGQQRGILKFALGVLQYQIVNHSFNS